MANEEQLVLLKAGVEGWNEWRKKEPDEEIDLTEADLSGANLARVDLQQARLWRAKLTNANLEKANIWGADLREANLDKANLVEANLSESDCRKASLMTADVRGGNLNRAVLSKATLSGAILRRTGLVGADLWLANLSGADIGESALVEAFLKDANFIGVNLERSELTSADLMDANLSYSNLTGANLSHANLTRANLTGANLTEANLINSNMIGAKVESAKISKSNVYGVNVWDLQGEFNEQKDLIITEEDQPEVTVDNIEVAQFIYLILRNEKIRDVINTLTAKSILILGRFAIPERKEILDALRNRLREYDLLPIVFDFDRPTDKDFTETIKTLAGLSLFVIADVTNPKSSPLELQATVPDYQIPFVPIIQEGEQPFAMMVDLHKKYKWVLEPRSYDNIDTLMKALKPGIIEPAMRMHAELRLIKAKEQVIHPLQNFIDKG